MLEMLRAGRRTLLAGASAAALIGLSACDGPPRPEPSAPPPSPEQAYDDEAEAYETAELDEEEVLDGKPPEEDEPAEDDEAYLQEDEAGAVEADEFAAMDPIPNPGDGRDYAERDEGREYARRDDARADDVPELVPLEREDSRGEARDPAPVIADAADAPPLAVARMAPIPNPAPRQPRPRADDGLLGAPGQRAVVAQRAPTPAPQVYVRPAAGPRVRVPIAPAPGVPAAAASPPRTAAAIASTRPTAATTAATPAATQPADRPAAARATSEADLRRLVEREARLDVPTTWTAGETREVRLRLPASLAERLETLSGDGLTGAREVSATLVGEGFRIDPAGSQSVDPRSADAALAWRVTPESANPGRLSARVETRAPSAQGEARTVSLGEVGDRRGSGSSLSLRTLGWILLVVLGGALLAWLAGRRNGDQRDAESRRRRRARAEQRRDRAGPLDLAPGSGGPSTQTP